jgi:hypothetical protein
VAEPAQAPPRTRGVHAALRVVDDDLGRGTDRRGAELRRERLRIGERMAAVPAGHRRREVPVEVQETRAGDVRLRILARTPVRPREVVAAVEHDPGRIVEVAAERIRVDERGVGHAVSVALRWNIAPRTI